jgi:hypothetical protein
MAVRNNILIGTALVFREGRGRRTYLVVKQGEEDRREFPKVTVRRGESSVRAVIRMIGEAGGISARVLEEVDRTNSVVVVNGKPLPQRLYYYLMVQKSAGEIIGFAKFEWLIFKKAFKKLTLKKEKEALKKAEAMLKQWEREGKKKKP